MSRFVFKVAQPPPFLGSGFVLDPVTGLLDVASIAPQPLSGAILGTDAVLISRNIGTVAVPNWQPFYATPAQVQALAGSSSSSTTPIYGGPNALVLDSAGAGGATTPHQDAFLSSVLALLDVRVKMPAQALSGGTALGEVVGTWGPVGSGYAGWMAVVTAEGYLAFVTSDSGTSANLMTLTTVPPTTPNTDVWLRWVYVISGDGANQCTMYSCADGVNYVRLGLAYGSAGARVLVNTLPLTIGNGSGNPLPANTNIRAVQIYTELGKFIDIDFTNAAAGATTVTASTGQVFTVNAPAVIAA